MASEDIYAVLGVLPDAEDVVIIAAYRALAQRYHPDRWRGDVAEANRRMSAINRAYAVLGDKVRRAEYDNARAKSHQAEFTAEGDNEQGEAFTSAMSELEERWKIACSIYPDLAELRSRLARISTSLAFAFVTMLLDAKTFPQRVVVASHLEHAFLERYFGTDQNVLAYARTLIFEGRKAEAKALNRLVEVMGSEAEANRLIARIEADFDLLNVRKLENEAQLNMSKVKNEAQLRKDGDDNLANLVRYQGYYGDACELSRRLGYIAEQVGGGFFTLPEVVVTTPAKETLRFKNSNAFISWVRQNLIVSKW